MFVAAKISEHFEFKIKQVFLNLVMMKFGSRENDMFIVIICLFMIYIDCWQLKIAVKILTCIYNSIAINIFEFEFS